VESRRAEVTRLDFECSATYCFASAEFRKGAAPAPPPEFPETEAQNQLGPAQELIFAPSIRIIPLKLLGPLKKPLDHH
jgi:hypothetical protein